MVSGQVTLIPGARRRGGGQCFSLWPVSAGYSACLTSIAAFPPLPLASATDHLPQDEVKCFLGYQINRTANKFFFFLLSTIKAYLWQLS